MSWALLVGLVGVLGFALSVAWARSTELRRMRRALGERDQAERAGSAQAQLQHPVVDLSRCLGCATCVAVCPEDGVLEIVHGQAMIVNGARCQGISACERECPVGAITVTLGDLRERDDVPVLRGLEADGTPGLFLAGEVTAHALIKTAVEHGTAVADEVARRVAADVPAPLPSTALAAARAGGGPRSAAAVAEPRPSADDGVLDLVVVGAGPAGLACSLQAKQHGLRFATLDQEDGVGGTVAKYPRRKLVLTEPVALPLHGPLDRRTYTKEELMEVWRGVAEQHRLPLHPGQVFEGLEQDADGRFHVRTRTHTFVARHVCLALGRRGSPRRLGVPGEDLPKVAYSLLDASSYQGRRVLVVGGGDSAVETALGLAEQAGNEVTLSYRKDAFFRIRKRNEERLRGAVEGQRLRVLVSSEVASIAPDSVELTVGGDGGPERLVLPNDEVFVMAGGVAPFDLLRRAGVSFDHEEVAVQPRAAEQGTGLIRALAIGFAISVFALAWALGNADYYGLVRVERPAHEKHLWLRPGQGLGLVFGGMAATLIGVNLLYLVRRSPRFRLRWGSLQAWMTSHVATGILALLLATLHGAMEPRHTVGGHALWALVVLLVTGAIGRYFYAYVPRAANGRELELKEVKSQLERLSRAEGEDGRFGQRARDEVLRLIHARQWRGTFTGRVLALCGLQLGLRRTLRRLAREGAAEGVDPEQVREALGLARRAHRTALMVAHYEDLRAVLNTWRYLHRWVAALMVLLVVVHVAYALSYGAYFEGGGG